MSLGMKVGLGPGDFVLDGDPAPPPKKKGEQPRQFSVHVYCGQMARWPRRNCVRWGSSPQKAHAYCGQTARWIKMPLGRDYREVGLGPGDIVLDGDTALSQDSVFRV